ncbi:MAG: peptidase S10 [Gemmatimonadota bacterium]|nr:peptidase S10 [Gemmatimonadota bacterium]
MNSTIRPWMRLPSASLAMLLLAAMPLAAQGSGRGGPGPQGHPYDPSTTDAPPVVTHHSIEVGGKTYSYTATAGRLPVPDAEGKTEAHIFFVAYTLDGQKDDSQRPLSFIYNGGPGEPAIWVHVGGFGPKRIVLQDNGALPPPPYKMVDNQETWLPFTDMVFIDPDGTGYSRAVSEKALAATSGVAGDLQSLGEFIRLYLTKYDRYSSPLYLAGESYGTFRSAGLAGYLAQRGIALNGVMLLSSVLDMQTLGESTDNDLPNVLFMPTYTATAWYHKKLPPDLQKLSLKEAVAQSEHWATTDYMHDLYEGDALQGAERQQAVDQMARYTGLPAQLIDDYNLRVSSSLFDATLLQGQKQSVGRLDGRMVSFNRTPGTQRNDFDPSWVQRPVYTQMFTQYVRDDLGYKTDDVYGGGIAGWNYDGYGNNMSELLESAFAKNPYMKLLLATGYYDFACPFFEAEYSMHHLFLPPDIQKNITVTHYEVGHMIYQDDIARKALESDVRSFIANSDHAKAMDLEPR